MKEVSRNRRLFFALWPSKQTRDSIRKTLNSTPGTCSSGRKMLPDNYHITLHFIGNVSDKTMNCLHRAASRVTGKPFDLRLDQFGIFRKPKLLWIGPEQVPDALNDLHLALGKAFQRCGYTDESRSYIPHVTLMRRITSNGLPESPDPIEWHAAEFVLVESTLTPEGTSYEVLQHYPLTA